MWIDDAVVAKLPPEPKKNTLLYVAEDGGLTRNDPQTTYIGSARSVEEGPDEKSRARSLADVPAQGRNVA